MISKKVAVSSTALESREVAKFINRASEFKSQIMLEKGERQANAKSLLGVMSLNAFEGNLITIKANGADEEEAVSELSKFIESK